MTFFNLQEHTNCHYYAKDMQKGFRLYEMKAGEILKEDYTALNYLVFARSGSMLVTCGPFSDITMKTGEMIFVPRSSLFRFRALEDSCFIVGIYANINHLCNKAAIAELSIIARNLPYEFKPMTIHHCLQMFLDLISVYLKDGVNCTHLHEIKMQECFWLLRAYYTKEELSNFMHPVIGNAMNFRDIVLSNYHSQITVQDLANDCRLSTKSFNRQFLEEFGEAPHSWMHRQMIGRIRFRLSDKEITLKDIIDEFQLSSLPHLVRLCKKHFGVTPGEIRKQMQCSNTYNKR